MREIKFRAWDTIKKVMIQPSEIHWLEFNKDIWLYDDREITFGDTSHLELMQFIGLNDKDEAELYEGDIVKGEYSEEHLCYDDEKEDKWEYESISFRGEIVWDNQESAFMIKRPFGSETLNMKNKKYIEKIGNIYENPELLEKSNDTSESD